MTTEQYDAESIRGKYDEERDRRLIDGRADIVDLRRDARLARYRRDPWTDYQDREAVADDIDVLVVGGGMAGILAGVHLRKEGIRRIRIVDEAGGVGGTWYWNRFPGLMCDTESYVYLPMLEDLDYIPKNRYAFGDEILAHFEALAAKYDLTQDALFHTRVETPDWVEERLQWRVRTDRGDEITAKYVIMATGILNLMKLPAIPGMDSFRGTSFHTARWNYDYTGGTLHGGLDKLGDKTVAVVGVGGTAVQCVPHLAAGSKQVLVFQRTPSAVGWRDNRPTSDDFADDLQPGWQRERMENFQAILQARPVDIDLVDDGWTRHWAAATAMPPDPSWSMEEYQRRVEDVDFEIMEAHRRRVDETVDDPATAESLKPYYRYPCKRPLFHDEFLLAFNRPNVELVDCPAGVERITETGLVANGREYDVDCIIFATGFEAEMTPLPRRVGHQITGRNGEVIADRWADGPRTLHGIMSRGFPNMFLMPCPFQQGPVTANHTLGTIEVAEHVGQVVASMQNKHVAAFDVSEAAEDAWCEKFTRAAPGMGAFLAECTPSRLNNEGDYAGMNRLAGNYGDFFRFKKLLATWREADELEGLELIVEPTRAGGKEQ
ncbi:MAG: flavin-containing monooxygenase [Acidimicrobiales bacterium]